MILLNKLIWFFAAKFMYMEKGLSPRFTEGAGLFIIHNIYIGYMEAYGSSVIWP